MKHPIILALLGIALTLYFGLSQRHRRRSTTVRQSQDRATDAEQSVTLSTSSDDPTASDISQSQLQSSQSRQRIDINRDGA